MPAGAAIRWELISSAGEAVANWGKEPGAPGQFFYMSKFLDA